MRRLPPLGSIQAFVQVARLGSLRAAADSLSLSGPALTRRVQALEQYLGANLFERQHNALMLNERGESFLEEVVPHVEALSVAVDRATRDGRAMRIRVAVPSLFAAQRLLPLLPQLRRSHPSLLIDVDTGANRIGRLGDGIDAAIAITDDVGDKHYARLIETAQIVAIGRRPLAQDAPAMREPHELRRTPVIMHSQMPRAYDQWRRALGYPDLEPMHISYFDAGQLVLDAAAEGLGVAFMLQSHLAFSTDKRLAQVFDGTADSSYAYWFVCQHDALRRPAVKIFHDWLFQHFGQANLRLAEQRTIGRSVRAQA